MSAISAARTSSAATSSAASSASSATSDSKKRRTSIPSIELVHQRRLAAIKEASQTLSGKQIWEGKVSSEADLQELCTRNRTLRRLFKAYLESFTPVPIQQPYDTENLGKTKPDIYKAMGVYEKGEVLKIPQIYYYPGHLKSSTGAGFKGNFGFDDDGKNYICTPGDQVLYRYEINQQLGKGAFGTVISAQDHKTGKVVALKIIKNQMEWSLQAVNEVKFLKRFSELNSNNLVRYIDHFHFRSHMCIVTELLSVNLFQIIEATKFEGLGMDLVKSFARDTLRGLKYIHGCGAIHCDMKPENLMVYLHKGHFHVKLIDFGSSCSADHLSFSYLQSRYYRAPEVLLGARYNCKIDVWSVGAIFIELLTGMPIFQAADEYALLDQFLNYFGPPSKQLIASLQRQLLTEGPIVGTSADSKINYDTLLWRGFDETGQLRTDFLRKKRPQLRFAPYTKTIGRFIVKSCHIHTHESQKLHAVKDFTRFVSKCFAWEGPHRSSCGELLQDKFFANTI